MEVAVRNSGSTSLQLFNAYHEPTAVQHQTLAKDLKGKEYGPVAVATVSLKGKLYYTALWEKTGANGWLLSSSLDGTKYQRWLETTAGSNQHLVYVNAYRHDNRAMFSRSSARASRRSTQRGTSSP